jgi:hypothetical protein
MSVSMVLSLYTLTGLGFIAYLFSRKKGHLVPLRLLYVACIPVHTLFVITLWHAPAGSRCHAEPGTQYPCPFLIRGLHAVRHEEAHLGAGGFFLPVATCVLAFIAPSLQRTPEALMGPYRYFYPCTP